MSGAALLGAILAANSIPALWFALWFAVRTLSYPHHKQGAQ